MSIFGSVNPGVNGPKPGKRLGDYEGMVMLEDGTPKQ
jgi:hypothetical protein